MERIVETLVWAYVNTRGNSIYIHNFGMVKKTTSQQKLLNLWNMSFILIDILDVSPFKYQAAGKILNVSS